MPQITTIRVIRSRKYQPEQFGGAGAEVELIGNLLEGENHITVARQMLIDTRKLVYENLGLKLPTSIVAEAAEVDTPTETAKVAIAQKPSEVAQKPRGRPPGSKNKVTSDAEAAADIPGDDDVAPNIRTNPENRVNPDDDIPDGNDEATTTAGASSADDIPGDETPAPVEEKKATETNIDAQDLHVYINASISSGKLTVKQAKDIQREMGFVRVRDLDPSKLGEVKRRVDLAIAANGASK
jgi:hypothetical protein